MNMHYLTFVFIPQDVDIEAAVAAALRPFGHEFPVKPWQRHLDPVEIARMAKHYRVRKTSLRRLASTMEDWNGGQGGVDARGLFAMHTFNPDTKWDWYEIGGRWQGFLPGNIMTAPALRLSPNFTNLLPHDFLTPDGQWHEVETFQRAGTLGGCFIRKSPRRWQQELTTALATFPNCRIVGVDRHL